MQYVKFVYYALLVLLFVVVLLGLAAQVLTVIRHGERATDELKRVERRWRERAGCIYLILSLGGWALLALLFVRACGTD